MRVLTQSVGLRGGIRCLLSRTYMQGLAGRVGVLGVPFGKGQKSEDLEKGLIAAPDKLRGTDFIREIDAVGYNIINVGDVPTCTKLCTKMKIHNMNNYPQVITNAQEVARSVQKTMMCLHRACLVLGGDHSLALGSIAGHAAAAGTDDVAVIYVDAHADINTNCTSMTGNMHGMPVALVSREMQVHFPMLPCADWLTDYTRVCLSNVAYIGLRSVDPEEARFFQDHNVAVFSMQEVDHYGISGVLKMALRRVDPQGCRSIHLSFDIDALDEFEAPATTLPVRGGLTLREGMYIAEALCQTGRLEVMDLVEVNPSRGSPADLKKTLEAAKMIILAAFGIQRRGNVPSSRPPSCYPCPCPSPC